MKTIYKTPITIIGITVLLDISFNFISCQKAENPNWTRYEYLNEARDYIYFKKGTWWVYQNLQDDRLDTIEVTKSMIDTATLTGGGNTLYYEYLEWVAKSRMNGYQYRLYRSVPLPDPTYINAKSTLFRIYEISKAKPGRFLGITQTFISPFAPNYKFDGATHYTQFLSQYDTLTINGTLFKEVLVFEITDDGTFIYDELDRSGGTVRYYWSPKLGIVQMQHMTKNIQWVLVESHVYQ